MRTAKKRQSEPSEDDNIPCQLRIDRLVREERLQFRPLDPGTVKRYASVLRSGRVMPPVKVADLNGASILVDGWHRVAALESLGKVDVQAVVEPVASLSEAEWLAAKANTEHGLRLKASEYRKVFRAFIGAGKHRCEDRSFKSYREIAAELGGARGHTTIRNWMRQDYPSVFRAMRGHDEPFDPMRDHDIPSASLAPIVAAVFHALNEARTRMPAVSDPSDRGELVDVLEQMLNEAKSMPWEPVPF